MGGVSFNSLWSDYEEDTGSVKAQDFNPGRKRDTLNLLATCPFDPSARATHYWVDQNLSGHPRQGARLQGSNLAALPRR